MAKVRIDGIDYEPGSAEHLQAQAKLDAERDEMVASLEAKIEGLKTEKDALTARADSLTSEVEELKAKGEELASQERVDQLVERRLLLIEKARKVLGDEFRADGKTDSQIKREAISKAAPERNLEEKSDAYVDAYFDAICEHVPAKRSDSLAGARMVADVAAKTTMRTSEQARLDMIETNKKAWQSSLACSK